MPVDTETDVEKVEIVRDEQGDVQRPANTAEQQATQTAVESAESAVDTAASEIVAEIAAALSYTAGNCRDEDGSAYPYSENPPETIRELGFQVVGGPVDVQITTTGGDVFTVPVETSGTVLNRWAIDSIEITDPTGNAARVAWWWAGE